MSKVLVKNSDIYFAQNDDLWQGVSGSVLCCPVSNALYGAMRRRDIYNNVMNSGIYSQFEDYYFECMVKSGFSVSDRGNHNAHTKTLLDHFKLKTVWDTNGRMEDVIRLLDQDIPLVTSVDYKEAGHVKTIVGYDDDGLYVHDSYGIRRGASNSYATINPGWGANYGKFDHCSWALLDQIARPLWIRIPSK
jgi:hypothetical protein